MAQEEKRVSPEKEIISSSVGSSGQNNSNNNKNNNNNNNNNNRRSEGGGSFKFNADAAEFVPRSYATRSSNSTNNQMSSNISTGYFYPYVQFLQDGHGNEDPDHNLPCNSPDWFYVNPPMLPPPSSALDNHININNINNNNKDAPPLLLSNSSTSPRNYAVSDDLQQKIIKQVEYLFSDLSLMANDTMAKHVNKDPEGYVPIAVIGSMKKIKALVADHHSLVQPLRSSTKLVVSKDSKKVKRRTPFTENYRDELQCRTVMVENLPDDHSYQNLEKLFRAVGSVKAIRLCHPPEANPCRSKNEGIISNKLHALVEYETAEMAERAGEELNDERNWRRGMRVRVMLRCSPKSVLKNRKSDFDMLTDDEEGSYGESPKAIAVGIASSPSNGVQSVIDNTGAQGGEDCSRKASGRGRIKTKGGRNNDRGLGLGLGLGSGLLSSPPPTPTPTTPVSTPTMSSSSPLQMQCSDYSIFKQRGPRMPDGTRGFTMGRGRAKPLLLSSSSPPLHL